MMRAVRCRVLPDARALNGSRSTRQLTPSKRTRPGARWAEGLVAGCLLFTSVWPVTLARGGLIQTGGGAGAAQTPPKASPRPSETTSAQDWDSILGQCNVFIEFDARLFAVMAALNIAGYDYESAGSSFSPIRQSLRNDLAGLDPGIRDRLRAYYRSHRLVGVDEPGQVARYVALSFLISAPPVFAVSVAQDSLPEDVVSVLDFVPLLRSYYETAGVGKIFARYQKEQQGLLRAYREVAGRSLLETLNYLHTRPILTISSRRQPKPGGERGSAQGKSKRKDNPAEPARSAVKTRERRLYVLANPLDARDSAYLRNDVPNGTSAEGESDIGDNYLVAAGPSLEALASALRIAGLRFTLEPLGVVNGREIRSRSDAIAQLFKKVTGREAGVNETAFFTVTQSLSAAAEARIRVLSVPSTDPQAIAEREEDAMVALSQQYQRGAVLAFHFYEKLQPWEKVGVDIAGYFEPLITSITFGREFERVAEIETLRAKLEKKRTERAPSVAREPLTEKLTAADALIQQRKYADARSILEEILKSDPEHARALYGLAQIRSGLASQVDPSKATDPNAAQDEIVGHLQESVKLFRHAAERARPPAELWLASQARVAAGRILDYFNERGAALEEYRLAVELGPVAGGAYDQAKAGVDHPLSR